MLELEPRQEILVILVTLAAQRPLVGLGKVELVEILEAQAQLALLVLQEIPAVRVMLETHRLLVL